MNLTIAQSLVKNELSKHNLSDWEFNWNNAKTINGQCFYVAKTIKLSKNYVELNPFDLVYNTILHEVAHALNYSLYKEVGHGFSWKKIALSIGCNGNRTSIRKVKAKANYIYKCLGCGRTFERYRKVSNLSEKWHKRCGKVKGKLIEV